MTKLNCINCLLKEKREAENLSKIMYICHMRIASFPSIYLALCIPGTIRPGGRRDEGMERDPKRFQGNQDRQSAVLQAVVIGDCELGPSEAGNEETEEAKVANCGDHKRGSRLNARGEYE